MHRLTTEQGVCWKHKGSSNCMYSVCVCVCVCVTDKALRNSFQLIRQCSLRYSISLPLPCTRISLPFDMHM